MQRILAGLLLAFAASGAPAQDDYPSRTVTAIVGYLPGGAADIVMRKLASIMASKFPADLIVENKPGAGRAAKKNPDSIGVGFPPMETTEFKDFTAMAALNVNYQDGDWACEAALTDFKTYTSILKQNTLIK